MGKQKLDLNALIKLCNACNPCFIGCTTNNAICTTIYVLYTTIYWWCTAAVILIAFTANVQLLSTRTYFFENDVLQLITQCLMARTVTQATWVI